VLLGVAGDVSRKGELFGLENLLKFKDGTFMNYASKMSESKQYGVGVYDTNSLLETVKDLKEDELDAIGDDSCFPALIPAKMAGKASHSCLYPLLSDWNTLTSLLFRVSDRRCQE
jgi:hypothetical protein